MTSLRPPVLCPVRRIQSVLTQRARIVPPVGHDAARVRCRRRGTVGALDIPAAQRVRGRRVAEVHAAVAAGRAEALHIQVARVREGLERAHPRVGAGRRLRRRPKMRRLRRHPVGRCGRRPVRVVHGRCRRRAPGRKRRACMHAHGRRRPKRVFGPHERRVIALGPELGRMGDVGHERRPWGIGCHAMLLARVGLVGPLVDCVGRRLVLGVVIGIIGRWSRGLL